jgi:hypothetical protein
MNGNKKLQRELAKERREIWREAFMGSIDPENLENTVRDARLVATVVTDEFSKAFGVDGPPLPAGAKAAFMDTDSGFNERVFLPGLRVQVVDPVDPISGDPPADPGWGGEWTNSHASQVNAFKTVAAIYMPGNGILLDDGLAYPPSALILID